MSAVPSRLDAETGTYYLRARYYDPTTGRFTQEDTHWDTANMIYGDNPQKINEREDKLGLKTYSYAPQITAVMQSGNLYVYCGNSPLYYTDPTGCEWYHWLIGGLIVAATAVAVVVTAGGIVPAMYAVSAVACGTTAATTASTVAASAFVGATIVVGSSLLMADYSSIENFNASADWSTVLFTAGGLLVGGAHGYTLYQNSKIQIAGKGSTGRTEAANLHEQLAMKQVISNPLYEAKELTNIRMNDLRWHANDGWVKMERIIKFSDGTKVVIHFLYNTITKIFDNFKFKN